MSIRLAALEPPARPPHVAPRRQRRGSRRTIGWAAVALGAAVFLAPQFAAMSRTLEVLAGAEPGLVLAGIGLVALRFILAAISLRAAVAVPLPFVPTLLVQLASAFVGRFTPEGIGWLVLNQRFLEVSDVPRSSALAGISLKLAAGLVTRIAIAAIVIAAIGGTTESPRPIGPELGWLPATLVAALVVVAIAVASRVARPGSRLRPAITSAAVSLREAIEDPRRMVVLLGSAGSLTLLSGLVLATSAAAVGAQATLASIFAVYLGGSALAALSPTPGNLGALEATLTAGLVASGFMPPVALATVLLYRLLTFWLPVIPGFLALRQLHASSAL